MTLEFPLPVARYEVGHIPDSAASSIALVIYLVDDRIIAFSITPAIARTIGESLIAEAAAAGS